MLHLIGIHRADYKIVFCIKRKVHFRKRDWQNRIRDPLVVGIVGIGIDLIAFGAYSKYACTHKAFTFEFFV